MFNVEFNKSKIVSIISGILISVLIYYLNYFSNAMGINEEITNYGHRFLNILSLIV